MKLLGITRPISVKCNEVRLSKISERTTYQNACRNYKLMAASVISLLATISLVADTFKEVCSLFQITKPTLYDWIKKGKLKPIHVSSRPYFLLKDIQELLQRK